MAAKTSNLYAIIELEVKEEAESILAALGIPVSNAINMFYKQIILNREGDANSELFFWPLSN